MNNLKNRIQDLMSKTTSPEVKAACSQILGSGQDINESALASLTALGSKDAQVAAMLNEMNSFRDSILEMQMNISKNAAERLSANWNTKKVGSTSVGSFKDEVREKEMASNDANNQTLLEKLEPISSLNSDPAHHDATTRKVVDSIRAEYFGVKEAVSAIAKSEIAKHPQMVYLVERFSNLVASQPESRFVRDFVSAMSVFEWDNTVKVALEGVKSSLEVRSSDIEVQNAILDIKATDKTNFYSAVVESMESWIVDQNKNIPELLKTVKPFMFHPTVKRLANNLMLMENSKGTTFHIPIKTSNCEVSQIFSPVHFTKEGDIFKAGNKFFISNKKGVSILGEAQINALPQSFHELCESFSKMSVENGDIVAYVNKTKVRLSDNKAYIADKIVEGSNLGSTLSYHNRGSIFGSDMSMINHIVKVYENMQTICEIDYGKSLFSTIYEGVGVFMFKRGNKLFINKMNPSMNEDTFFSANGVQTVKMVKEFLSYDLSESVVEFIRGENVKIGGIKKRIDETLGYITQVESEIDKIEAAIQEDPSVAEIEEIASVKETLENELNDLRKEWRAAVSELKKFEELETCTTCGGTGCGCTNEGMDDDDDNDDDDNDDNGGGPDDDDPEGNPDGDVAGATDDDVQDTGAVSDTEIIDDDETEDTEEPGEESEISDEPEVAVEPNGETIQPVGDLEPQAEEEPVHPAIITGVVDSGLLGAGGSQSVNIPGNDHMLDGIPTADGLANAGFAGAEGAEGASCDPGVEIAVADNSEIPTDDMGMGDTDTDTDTDTDMDDDDDIVISGEPEIVGESFVAGDSVKVKASGKVGKIASVDTNDSNKFSVLLDDGETTECGLDGLEPIDDKIETAIDNNEVIADAEAGNQGETAQTVETAGGVHVHEDEQTAAATTEVATAQPAYVQATVTIDIGPYKAGDAININAADYTSMGDEDTVMVKDPKDPAVPGVQKKYIKVEDVKADTNTGSQTMSDVIKNIDNAETLLGGVGKIDKASQEAILVKIKSMIEKIEKQAGS